MSSNANEQQYPMILTRTAESVDLSIDHVAHDWVDETRVSRGVWDLIAPIAWRDCPERLFRLLHALDGERMEFDDDDHSQSIMWLGALITGMSPTDHLVDIAHCWAMFPLSERAGFWRQGTGYDEKTVHAQLLGTRSEGTRPLASHVPDWLPRLVRAIEKYASLTQGWPINWSWATTPFGTSCIAWCDYDPNNTDSYLEISTCPVTFSRAFDPGREMGRRAIDILMAARDANAASEDWRQEFEWSPTGHDLFEVEATLRAWQNQLS